MPKDDETIKDLWSKRIGRIVIILVAFSFVYYVQQVYHGDQEFKIRNFFSRLYASSWNASYWYLYTYIQMLITLPFLRALAQNLKNTYYHYLFVLNFFFNGILPMTQFLFWRDTLSLNENLRLGWLTVNIVFYPLMGYFLQNRIQNIEKKGKQILNLWIVNVLSIILCCFLTYLKVKITGECSERKSQAFHNSFSMINTATIFLTVKYLFLKYGTKISGRFESFIFNIGQGTLGIYLWHIMVLRFLEARGIWEFFHSLKINQLISSFLVCLCVMMISYVFTYIMKKIPYVRKLVY